MDTLVKSLPQSSQSVSVTLGGSRQCPHIHTSLVYITMGCLFCFSFFNKWNHFGSSSFVLHNAFEGFIGCVCMLPFFYGWVVAHMEPTKPWSVNCWPFVLAALRADVGSLHVQRRNPEGLQAHPSLPLLSLNAYVPSVLQLTYKPHKPMLMTCAFTTSMYFLKTRRKELSLTFIPSWRCWFLFSFPCSLNNSVAFIVT